MVTTHVRNRRGPCDDERLEQPGMAIAGDDARGTVVCNELNRAAIAWRN